MILGCLPANTPQIQLEHVIRVCRESDSMADASKRLFAVSFKEKKSSNNSDRLFKYLARYGLKFKNLKPGRQMPALP